LPILLLFGLVLPLFAQEEDPEEDPGSPPIESDWEIYAPEAYSRGDKTFNISLGLIIPTVFGGEGIDTSIPDNTGFVKLGGTGSLAFNYFLSSHLFLGGELGGMFAPTRGKNMFFIVPFGVRVGWQFVVSRFEFPITLMIGASPTKYLEQGYFGLIIKPGASVFYRFNPDWSFGVNANWWLVPQWPKGGKNVLGNFVEVTLSARYHF
jgi:hypothetical protein